VPLFLEQNFYLNLQNIIDNNKKSLFQERRLKYLSVEGKIAIRYADVRRYHETPLPDWFRLRADINIPAISDLKMKI
jgi:hypothetical protein